MALPLSLSLSLFRPRFQAVTGRASPLCAAVVAKRNETKRNETSPVRGASGASALLCLATSRQRGTAAVCGFQRERESSSLLLLRSLSRLLSSHSNAIIYVFFRSCMPTPTPAATKTIHCFFFFFFFLLLLLCFHALLLLHPLRFPFFLRADVHEDRIISGKRKDGGLFERDTSSKFSIIRPENRAPLGTLPIQSLSLSLFPFRFVLERDVATSKLVALFLASDRYLARSIILLAVKSGKGSKDTNIYTYTKERERERERRGREWPEGRRTAVRL